ncbi:tyrosine-type recombinase/integrase [Desulfogranum japonicum]|uniref:tyrosine-type recombinase/integrase n=1 Tax=Desulfogranum japonicum TaxID=231447 RepID=UPI00040FD0CD|nr:site-specific integrase [Desulfogranum japonicum]
MSNTIRFIDTVIRNLQPLEKRQTFWCIGCPGFGIRVNPSGSKMFIFKYMAGDKKEISRWITIGKYPEWSIRRARHEYDELYQQVYEYGRDPVQEEKDEKAKQIEEKTVKDFTAEYLHYARLREKPYVDEEERYFRQDIWPVIGDKLFNEVHVDDIEQIQENILKRCKKIKSATRGGRVAIKYAIGATRRLFDFAIKKGLTNINPARNIEPLGQGGVRSRVLTFEEIWTFWNRIEMLDISPVPAKALKFLLATMQRSNEVRNIRYSRVNFTDAVWQMERHETKNRTMHRVPLNRYAIDLIEDVRPLTEASEYIFGSTKLFEPLKNPNPKLQPMCSTSLSQAIRRNRKHLGIDDFRPHDLRRTGATWITAVGLPKLYARLMLNHSDGERDVTGEVNVQYSKTLRNNALSKSGNSSSTRSSPARANRTSLLLKNCERG